MYCIFNFTMTTYYTIQTWRNRAYEWETFNLYETFDEACDTIEGYMKAYEDFDESDFEKIKPNREEKRKNIESWNRVAYLKMPNGEEKHIARLKIVPNKKETIREIPNLTEIARLLQGDMYKFKKVSVVEEADNCSYNVKYYPQDDDTLAYFLSLILAEHRNQHILLHLHKLADTNRYMIYMAVRNAETSADEEDKYLEANFEEVFKRSREVKYLNGHPVRNTWYDPVKKWAYQVYFPKGEKPQTFYDLESRNIKTIDFVEPKKYVYQYYVENDYKGITSLSLKVSPKYQSFDKMYDDVNTELTELHKSNGKKWKIPMSRKESKETLDRFPSFLYERVMDENDSSKSFKYLLVRTAI